MDDRLVNVVGAVALGLTDRITVAVERASGLVLGISASGVVRLLDRLVAERQALTAAVEKVLVALTPDVAVAEHVCRLCDLDACPQERCPADPDAR